MSPEATERRLAAIMFTDIVAYTALMAESEEKGLRAKEQHRALVRPLVEQYHGELIEARGDESLSVFPTALDAVNCALAIDEQLRNDPDLKLHIGIHLGDLVVHDGEVSGDGVNIASRICALSKGGGLCVSGEVHRSIRNQPRIEATALGEQTLKNVPEPVAVYSLTGSAAAPRPRSQEVPTPGRARRWLFVTVAALVVMVLGLWFSRPAPELAPIRSVAVLPFDNLSPNPEEDEYFSDGIHDEIISQLSKIAGLKVISRTSVMRYKGRDDRSLPEIASELGVATILEGTVRWAERRLRITVQLLDARTDEHLWTETYDRELTDIFAIQSDVAFRIAGALEAELSPSERERIERKPTESLEAYNLYLKGKHFWHRFTDEGKTKSVRYFMQARDQDPNFALAYVGLADVYGLIGCCSFLWGDLPPAEPYAKARRAADKALKIDSTLGEAYGTLGFIMFASGGDWVGSERAFRRAIELTPSDALAHTRYGILLLALGRYDEAIERTKRAQELDPLAPIISSDLAWAFLYAGRNDEALAEARRAIELEPDFPPGHHVLAEVHMAQGRYKQAIAAVSRAIELSPGGSRYLSQLAYAYAASGDRTRAEELARELQNRSNVAYVSPLSMAIIHASLGESDLAIDFLERAFQTEGSFLHLARAPFEFEGLRSHPRLVALRERIGLGQSPK